MGESADNSNNEGRCANLMSQKTGLKQYDEIVLGFVQICSLSSSQLFLEGDQQCIHIESRVEYLPTNDEPQLRGQLSQYDWREQSTVRGHFDSQEFQATHVCFGIIIQSVFPKRLWRISMAC